MGLRESEGARRVCVGAPGAGSGGAGGSASARSVSGPTKGSVSSENASASSSAYTSNSRGRLSRPSATCCIVALGESEKVGTDTSLSEFPAAPLPLPLAPVRFAFGSTGLSQSGEDA